MKTGVLQRAAAVVLIGSGLLTVADAQVRAEIGDLLLTALSAKRVSPIP